MMKLFNPCGTTPYVLALIAFAQVASAGVIEVTSSLNPLYIHEGDTGIVTWSVTNYSDHAVTIQYVLFDQPSTDPGLKQGLHFAGGDKNDAVSDFMFTDRDDRFPNGFVMAVGQTSKFHMQVETQDLQNPHEDNDSGMWDISIFIRVENSLGDSELATTRIIVTDGPAPAPGVAALFVVAGACGAGRRRR